MLSSLLQLFENKKYNTHTIYWFQNNRKNEEHKNPRINNIRFCGLWETENQPQEIVEFPCGCCILNLETDYFLTGASSRALTSRRQKGSAAGM